MNTRKTVVLASLVVLYTSNSFGQDIPSKFERSTTAVLFASSSVSMIPVWITAACTTAGTCHEINPFMGRVIGDGPIRAIGVKSAVSFGSHYAIWRMPSTTRTQKILKISFALGMLAINGYDAIKDIRVFRQLDSSRGQ